MAVRGLERLNRQIKALPEKQREAIAAVMGANAAQLAERIRNAAPRATGALAASVKARPTVLGDLRIKDLSPDVKRVVTAKGNAGLSYTVAAGGKEAFYAAMVEFGTAASPGEGPRRNRNYRRTVIMTKAKRGHAATRAQPYFWPTVRAWKKLIKSRVATAARKGLKAAAGVT